MPGLSQNFIHASLIDKGDESEPSVGIGVGGRWEGEGGKALLTHVDMTHYEEQENRRNQTNFQAPGTAPSPRALSNWISHHHTLLHLAVLAEVLLQTLWESKKGG